MALRELRHSELALESDTRISNHSVQVTKSDLPSWSKPCGSLRQKNAIVLRKYLQQASNRYL